MHVQLRASLKRSGIKCKAQKVQVIVIKIVKTFKYIVCFQVCTVSFKWYQDILPEVIIQNVRLPITIIHDVTYYSKFKKYLIAR